MKQERIGTVATGVSFLGCQVFAGFRTLNCRSRRRFRRKINLFDRLLHEGRIDEAGAQQRSLALCAFAQTACSHNFRRHVLGPHFRATAMGETVMVPTATSGAARGTTTRTTPPSRTGTTTTTRTTGTTTTGFRLARSSGTVAEATRASRTGRDPAFVGAMNLRNKTQQSPVRASRPRGFRFEGPGGGLSTRITPPLRGLKVPATLPGAALDRRPSD
ncbi:MAG: hypothetical protein JJT96_19750 [Opitutales bacterium]|nr:hypothetical protein [Opitutales bacterium]